MEETPLQLSDIVRFEIPTYIDADGLCAIIRPRWRGTVRKVGGVWVISARFRKTRKDLAVLLRTVEGYVSEAGLRAIRYQLDGRFYILEAAEVEHSLAV
jgi:hypothetical protein